MTYVGLDLHRNRAGDWKGELDSGYMHLKFFYFEIILDSQDGAKERTKKSRASVPQLPSPSPKTPTQQQHQGIGVGIL